MGLSRTKRFTSYITESDVYAMPTLRTVHQVLSLAFLKEAAALIEDMGQTECTKIYLYLLNIRIDSTNRQNRIYM